MKKMFVSLLTVALLLCALSSAAFAMPQTGSITILVDHAGQAVSGGTLAVCRVADIVEENGGYAFRLIEPLQESGLALDNVQDPQLAADLAALAQSKGLSAVSAPIEEGKAVFAELPAGLYVVTQTEATPGFFAMGAYLLSMPQYENGAFVADVVANPKLPLYPEQPTEPDAPVEPQPPTDPEVPATGQLNWPVPVLAVSGLVLFLVGWMLCFKRKNSGYEN